MQPYSMYAGPKKNLDDSLQTYLKHIILYRAAVVQSFGGGGVVAANARVGGAVGRVGQVVAVLVVVVAVAARST